MAYDGFGKTCEQIEADYFAENDPDRKEEIRATWEVQCYTPDPNAPPQNISGDNRPKPG